MPPRLSPVAGFPALKVQYFRRMKQNRVYPVTISWGSPPKPIGAIKNVTVRLLGAGAQIVPTEQALDAARPDLKAFFFVTPLARGWLRAQRVEVLIQGRKVQEIPLASKVVCQCWSAFLFLLACLAPAFLIWWRGTDPQWLASVIQHNVPEAPAMIGDQIPALNDLWTSLCTWKGESYAKLCRYNQQHLVAFPVGLMLLLLSLWSLLHHRDRKASRFSQPVMIPAGVEE
jgi:hypothetical protein